MDRDRGIAEHGLGPRGRDHDVAVRHALDRVADVPEMAVDLGRLDLEVRDRGLQRAVPVDQPLVLVDQAVAIEVDEHLPAPRADRPSSMVKRSRDQSADAPRRCSCWLMMPPDCAFHFQTSSTKASRPISRRLPRRQLALDHHLGRDARMIAAGLPQHGAAQHPMKARQGILQREIHRMTHVQAARDVGRRHHDAPGRGGRVAARRVVAGLLPCVIVRGLDLGGSECLVQHRRTIRRAWGTSRQAAPGL